MKLVFIGVGEAFDEEQPNTSILVSKDEFNLLLDCGYSVPRQLWKHKSGPGCLDAIYVSHIHADHYFGIPAILTRCLEEHRSKPITIISTSENNKAIAELLEYAYRGVASYFKFPVNYQEAKPNSSVEIGSLKLSFAPTEHTIENLAVKVQDKDQSFCFSGDGVPHRDAEDLYTGSELVIHDSYFWDKESWGHPKIIDLIPMAEKVGVKTLALVHLERNFRKQERDSLLEKASSDKINIILPEASSDYKFE